MYLQLAEEPERKSYGGFQQNKGEDNPYIFVPDPSGQSSGVWIREDYFDYMTPFEWRKFMIEVAPFQPGAGQPMSEGNFLNDRASRKAKRDDRNKAKQEKRDQKNKKREAKNELIKSRAQAKREGRGGAVLDSVINGVTSIFGKPGAGAETMPSDIPDDYVPEETPSPWYKNPLVIGAGILILAGGAYAISRKS